MENDQIEAINQMIKIKKSEELLKKSFDIFFKIDRDNIVSRTIIIIICCIFAWNISRGNTVVIMKDLSSTMLNVAIATFGIIFTGYTLFQAVLNKELISIFMKDIKTDTETKENRCMLHITNWRFVQLMMQFVVMMFVNLILIILLSTLSDDFCLFSFMFANEIIVFILLVAYFYQAMVILWRIISFLFNIYHLFNSYAISEFLSNIDSYDTSKKK